MTPTTTAATRYLRIALTVVVLIGIFIAVRQLPVDAWLERLGHWIDGLGLLGPVVFIGIYVVATVAFLPGAAITLAAGAIFGPWLGLVTVSAGSTIGAALAFLIARYLAREKVVAQAEKFPKFAAIDRAVGQQGWKIIGLLRLSPAIPFSLSNYLYGLTAVRFWPYVAASWVCMLPGTFLYVYLGYAGRAGIEAASSGSGRSPGEWSMLIIGLLATVAVTVYVTRIAKAAIDEQTVEKAPAPAAG